MECTAEEREDLADDYGYERGRCPRCHRTVWSDTGRFECSYCGEDSDPKKCAECGAKIADKDDLCDECLRLRDEPPEPDDSAPVQAL